MRSGKENSSGASSFGDLSARRLRAGWRSRCDAASRDSFPARPVAGDYHLPKRGSFWI